MSILVALKFDFYFHVLMITAFCGQWTRIWRQHKIIDTRFLILTFSIPMPIRSIVCSLLIALSAATLALGKTPEFTRTEDVIYGRKFGTALTMDVYRPKSGANGAAIIWVVSGGWFSSHELAPKTFGGGYTTFAVFHGSQPRYTIPDAVQDMNRAVRFIRYHAADYGIDPDRIGIAGGSAGGHLSLMQAIKPAEPDEKNSDPVERTSARVQAVACLFPPTDFLNYGEPGKTAWTTSLNWLPAAFEFQRAEQTAKANPYSVHFVRVNDEQEKAIAKEVSPVYWVTEKSPPTLIIHGDIDKVVPLEQSQRLIEKLEQAKVPAKLEVRKGKGHGWPDLKPDVAMMQDWFDQHLAATKK
jgi:acetyl esterase/lipase